MMQLAEVRDWLKGLGVLDATWSIGRYERGKERHCCVYNRADYATGGVAVGGRCATRDLVKSVSVLVYWNRNARESERAAQGLYDALAFDAQRGAAVGGAVVSYVGLPLAAPAGPDSDDDGIFGCAIWLDIHYQEKDGE